MPSLHVLASVLAWASAVVNPFVYAVTNRQYRSAYRKLFCCLEGKTGRGSNSHSKSNSSKTFVTEFQYTPPRVRSQALSSVVPPTSREEEELSKVLVTAPPLVDTHLPRSPIMTSATTIMQEEPRSHRSYQMLDEEAGLTLEISSTPSTEHEPKSCTLPHNLKLRSQPLKSFMQTKTSKSFTLPNKLNDLGSRFLSFSSLNKQQELHPTLELRSRPLTTMQESRLSNLASSMCMSHSECNSSASASPVPGTKSPHSTRTSSQSSTPEPRSLSSSPTRRPRSLHLTLPKSSESLPSSSSDSSCSSLQLMSPGQRLSASLFITFAKIEITPTCESRQTPPSP